MINVKVKKCEHVDCDKYACYAYHGNKACYCATHCLEGIVNVKNKMCEHDECKKQASYAFEGDKPVYCATHRLNGMILKCSL